MKITVKQDEIYEKLNIISDFLGKEEINRCIKLETYQDFLVASATNGHYSAKMKITANVSKSGQVVIPGKKLISIIKEVRSDEIKLTKTPSDRLGINADFYLASYDPDLFPTLPTPDGDKQKLQIKELLEDINKVSFAANKKGDNFTDTIFFANDLLYASDKYTSATYKSHNCKINLKVPKGIVRSLKCFNGQAVLFIQENTFFIKDKDKIFSFQLQRKFGPEDSLRGFLKNEPNKKIVYNLDETDLQELLIKLRQIRAIHERVIFKLTDNSIQMAGSSDDQVNFSYKEMKISPVRFKEEIIITINIDKLRKILKRVDGCEIIFTGDTKNIHKSKGVIHIFEGDFKVLLLPIINPKEDEILKEAYNGRS